jgi:hypothetical protein
MTLRALLAQLEAAPAGGLHLTVAVDGARLVLPLVVRARVAGRQGTYEVAIVQPPAPADPVLVLRAPRGQWVLCLPAEAARKGLALEPAQAAAAAAGGAWRAALAAERRAQGERPWRPR